MTTALSEAQGALSLVTIGAPDHTPVLSEFAEITEFDLEGAPLRWTFFRRTPQGVVALAQGAGAPPWNNDGIPRDLAAAAISDPLASVAYPLAAGPVGVAGLMFEKLELSAGNADLTLLRTLRQRKFGEWLARVLERAIQRTKGALQTTGLSHR